MVRQKKYEYDDINNTVTVTDIMSGTDALEQGFKTQYKYTPLGQIQQVKTLATTWGNQTETLLADYKYDANQWLEWGRKYNANGTVRSTTHYYYDAFGRVVKKAVSQVNYTEIHDYTDVYPYGARKFFRHVKTVYGELDAPSITTETLSDQKGQVAIEFLGDQKANSYAYDRLGNKVNHYDAKNNVTYWNYDCRTDGYYNSKA